MAQTDEFEDLAQLAPWALLGRVARLRREHLGLKQGELAQYGGPGVSTVGKIERAAQENFPTRTQHQLENALGWKRGTVRSIIEAPSEDWWESEELRIDWAVTLVEDDVPDLSRPSSSSAESRWALREAADILAFAQDPYRGPKDAPRPGISYFGGDLSLLSDRDLADHYALYLFESSRARREAERRFGVTQDALGILGALLNGTDEEVEAAIARARELSEQHEQLMSYRRAEKEVGRDGDAAPMNEAGKTPAAGNVRAFRRADEQESEVGTTVPVQERAVANEDDTLEEEGIAQLEDP